MDERKSLWRGWKWRARGDVGGDARETSVDIGDEMRKMSKRYSTWERKAVPFVWYVQLMS